MSTPAKVARSRLIHDVKNMPNRGREARGDTDPKNTSQLTSLANEYEGMIVRELREALAETVQQN